MHKNPYTEILGIMTGVSQNNQSPAIQIAIVMSPPPNLTLAYRNFVINNDDIYIADYLLPTYTRHMVGATQNRAGGGGYAEYASHNHPIDNDETWTDTLQTGDKVAVMPVMSEDGSNQHYIVLARILKPDSTRITI